MTNQVDISERWLLDTCPKAMQALLADHTTGQNIYWASHSYAWRGDGFSFFDPITIDKIKGDDVIVPRVCKSMEEQSRRVKEKAEVFTPAWICNAQNNLIDEAWFGQPDVFNRETVTDDGCHTWEPTGRFKESFGKPKSHKLKSWLQYIKDRRLEITCGEAPYLMSRYDAVSGKEILPGNRIGMFDRKMQVINHFEDNPTKWMQRTVEAIRATYGFEWQGDSLLLAREAMLLTILDYFFDKYPEERPDDDAGYLNNGVVIKRQPFSKFINNAAYYISWNLWQMDGLNFVLPGTSDHVYKYDPTVLFAPTPDSVKESASEILDRLRSNVKADSGGIPAVVSDWNHSKDEPRKIFFASLLKGDKDR